MDHAASHMGEPTTSKNKNNNVNKSVLDIFKQIAAKSDDARNRSCVSLVQHLTKVLEDESSGNLPKDVTYSLKRLVRGLGSKTQENQKGSFTALVAVLESFPVISYDTYMEIVSNEFKSNVNDSKGEEGEALLGCVFANGAAIRGGLFARSSVENQREILTTLITCAKKRSFLPYASAPFLHDLMVTVDESVLTDVIWPLVSTEVLQPWSDQTLETLLLLLSVFNRVPKLIKSKKARQSLGFELFSSESMQHFAEKLVGDSNPSKIKHPVYEEFCSSLCLPDNEASLKTFWTEVDSLLATPSACKDHASLHLFNLLLRRVANKKQIGMLVTSHILDAIGRTLSGPPAEKMKYLELYAKAQEAVASLGEVLTADDAPDKTRLSVIRKMLFSGNLQYEKQTGSRITVSVESKLSKKSVLELSKQFRDVVDGISTDEVKTWRVDDRIFAAQQLKRLIGHHACSNDNDWKVEQLLFLLHRGLFHESTSSPFNAQLAANVRKCFFRALDEAFSNFKTMVVVFNQVVQHINELMKDQKKFQKSLKVPFGPDASAAWQQMMKTVTKLDKKTESSGSEAQIFLSLFLFMGLNLFTEPKMAVESLQELHSCYERVKGGKRKSKNVDEPQWVEVTVEVLLSLLSNGSHLLRTVVGTVFPHLSKHLNVSAFYQILELLDPSQNENPLTSSKEMDEASESESEDEGEEMPANGTHKARGAEGSNESDEEESDDDDDEYEDIDDDDEEFDDDGDRFRDHIRQALGNDAALTDTESIDLDDISEEEGKRMDKALAEAFMSKYGSGFSDKMSRTSKKNKKQPKREETVTHFRMRVLDLVDLYISKEPSMELCVECITPLLSLISFCMKNVYLKTLGDRAKRVLLKLTGLTGMKKFSSVTGVEEEALAFLIKSLAIKGAQTTTSFLGLSDLISDCCTFLARCSEIVRAQSESLKLEKQNPVVDVYEALILEFFTKRESLLPLNIFKSVLNSQWSGCWCIAPSIVKFAFCPEARPFRRSQATDLLIQLFSNKRLVHVANEKQQERLKKLVASIISNSIQMLNADSSGKVQQKKHNIGAVMRLVLQILLSPKTRPADVSRLSTSVTTFCQNCGGVSSDTRKVLPNILTQLKLDKSLLNNVKKIDNAPVMNESSSDEEEETSEMTPRNKKNEKKLNGGSENNDVAPKHHNQKSRALSKKAKKMQRMALMGEGFDPVVFSDVNDAALNGMEPSDEEENVPKNDKPSVNGIHKRKPKKSTSEDPQNGKKKKKNH